MTKTLPAAFTILDDFPAVSYQQWRTMVEESLDWLYWRGPDGELLYMSPSCARMTGYTDRDFLADPELLLRILHPGDTARVVATLPEAWARMQEAELEVPFATLFGKSLQTMALTGEAADIALRVGLLSPYAEAVAKRLRAARRAFLDVVDFVAGNSKASPNAVYAGSVTYLLLAGNLVAGWQLGRALLIAQEQIAEGKDVDFMKAKIATARFYADHILSRVPGQRDSVVDGADSVTALALEAF